ncbi:MAG: nucleoside deaminase [Bacteroidales bacterium]|nr:nucleoside deaminase [Bacteroidales bacterium]
MENRGNREFMRLAIQEARTGIREGHGGPFGSVIVKDGKVMGKGHNRVLKDNDPSGHGEITAIRDACAAIGSYDLSGCEIYTTGEPCHMCLCACMWANISKIWYGCTIADNGRIGFRDDKFDGIFGGREKLDGYLQQFDREECLELFDEYLALEHKVY